MPDEPWNESSWHALLAGESVSQCKYYYKIAFKYLKNAEAAEDVTREVFAKALRRRDLRNPEALQPWLARMVANAALALLRKSKTERRVMQLHVSLPADNEVGHGLERQEAVVAAVGKLPEPARTIVTMRFLQDMSVKEIREQLKCSDAHVSRHVYSGIEILRKTLEEFGPDN